MPASAGAELTGTERARLAELEQVVADGLDAFLRVGRALAAIQRERLYRATHPSFPAYLRERWAMSEARASQLVATSETADVLQHAGADLPSGITEAALRQLTPTRRERGPDGVRAAWHLIVDRYGPDRLQTAHDVRRVLADAGYPVYGRAPGQSRPRLDQLDRILTDARARVDRIAGHQQRFDSLELERLADVARDLAAQLDRLAQPGGEVLEDLCVGHGIERDAAGVCRACRRPDLAAA